MGRVGRGAWWDGLSGAVAAGQWWRTARLGGKRAGGDRWHRGSGGCGAGVQRGQGWPTRLPGEGRAHTVRRPRCRSGCGAERSWGWDRGWGYQAWLVGAGWKTPQVTTEAAGGQWLRARAGACVWGGGVRVKRGEEGGVNVERC